MTHSPSVNLAQQLIQRQSVTPLDAGCQLLLTERLQNIGFHCEQIDRNDVVNLWATRGQKKPLLVFAGHTDVVPTGPVEQWRRPPFSGDIEDGMLHGRGAADMKGSIACFVTACERFVENNPQHDGAIGLLITSDEEGPADWGTKIVIDELQERGEQIDMCIVGEPTSVNQFGDMVKVGRRGSLNGKLIIKGKQGHIAYPHLALNPLHIALAPLSDLIAAQWDQGNENFPPTSFQMSNMHGGAGASNVIPGDIVIDFNFRYSPETTAEKIKSDVDRILAKHDVEYEVKWGKTGLPYETKRGSLVDAVEASIEQVTGIKPELSATGGTSDGRFIAPTGAQVVELGPINATIHQIDECVSTSDLDLLSQCYEKILNELLV